MHRDVQPTRFGGPTPGQAHSLHIAVAGVSQRQKDLPRMLCFQQDLSMPSEERNPISLQLHGSSESGFIDLKNKEYVSCISVVANLKPLNIYCTLHALGPVLIQENSVE